MKRKVSISRKLTSTLLSIVLITGLLPTPAVATNNKGGSEAAISGSVLREAEQEQVPSAGNETNSAATGEVEQSGSSGAKSAGGSSEMAETDTAKSNADSDGAQNGASNGAQSANSSTDSDSVVAPSANSLSVNSLDTTEDAQGEPLSALGSTLTAGWTKSGTCEWKIDDAGKLTVRPLGTTGTGTLDSKSPWRNNSSIKSVVFEEGVSAQTCYEMFSNCTNLTDVDFSGLDTSSVKDMDNMFYCCVNLPSISLTGLDTSAVTSMRGMFNCCKKLSYVSLAGLSTSKLKDMYNMFNFCQSLKSVDFGDINTSAVTDMGWMFSNCESLETIDLSNLDTSAVKYMQYMFHKCTSLSYINLTGLDTSAVTEMNNMFYECTSLKSVDFVGIDTSNVTTMSNMFYGCTSLESVDLSGINTSSITNISSMFFNCSNLETIYASSVFKVAETASSTNMFKGCTALKGGRGTTYSSENTDATMAKIDGGEEDPGYFTSGWTKCGTCEWRIDALTGQLTVRPFGTTGTGTLDSWSGYEKVPWYSERDSIKSVVIEQGVSAQTCLCMFANCTNLTSVDLSGLDTSAVTSMYGMFDGCSSLTSINLAGLDTSAVTVMYKMFYGCTSLTSVDFAGIDTSNVTAMNYMFHDCTSLTVVDFSDIDTSSVTETNLMFFNCPSLETIYASPSFKIAEGAYTARMFEGCTSLKGGCGTTVGNTDATMAKIDGGEEDPGYFTSGWTKCGTCEWRLDSAGKLTVRPIGTTGTGTLDAWDDSHGVPWDSLRESITSVVFEQGVCAQTCASMFEACINLVSVDLGGLDTSAVTSMNKMFGGCTSLTQADLAGMDTSNVTNMRYMFNICISLTSVDLSNIDTSSVTDMGLMFFNCVNLKTIYASSTFTVAEGAESTRMFENCASLKGGSGTVFDEENIDATMAKIDGGEESPGYFTDDWTPYGTCEWHIDSDGTLTIRPLGSTGTGTLDAWSESSAVPWYSSRESIKSVVIEPGVCAQTCASMFEACQNLTSVDLMGLNISAVTSMNKMFEGCTSIAKLVLPAGMDLKDPSLLSSSWRASTGENYETTAEMLAANASRTGGAITYRTISVTSGWAQSGSCEWRIDNDGLLIVRPLGSSGTGTFGEWKEIEGVPWYYQRETITAVKVVTGVSVQTGKHMFEGCTNLVSADLSGLDASGAIDMKSMFDGCSSLTSVNFGNINTSSVTNMSSMFDGCTNLEAIDLSSFDTSAVTNAQYMFRNCSSLTSLDFSCNNFANVKSMADMLSGCSALGTLTLPAGIDFSNSGLHDAMWTDSSENTYASTASMFSANASRETDAMSYKAVVIPEGWTQSGTCEWQIDAETGQLTVRPLSGISAGTLDMWTKIEDVPWYSSRESIKSVVIEQGVSAKTCRSMFEACKNLTSVNLAGLDTSAVTDMSYMFSECASLASVNLVGLNTSAVVSMNNMFYGCTSLTQVDLAGIDTSKVTNMNLMFRNCTSLVSVDLSDIDTSLVANMSEMFMNCTSLVTIYASPVFKVIEGAVASRMFEGCAAIEGGSGTTYVSSTTDATMAKIDGGEEAPGYFTYGWTEYGTCEWRIDAQTGQLTVRPANGAATGTLDKWTKREEVPWYSSRESIKSVVVEQGASAQTCLCMFEGCTNLVSVDLTGLDTSAVTDMSSMFYGCTSLTSIDLMSLDTSSVASMWGMFNGCTSLEHAYLAGLYTPKLVYMTYMFHECTNLVTVDLTGVDASSVSNTSYMFWNCQSLTTIYASSDFKVAEGVVAAGMFIGCSSLKGECGTTVVSVDATGAKIDGGQEDPGYFTTGWDKCGTCEWKIDSAGKLIVRPFDGRSTGTLSEWDFAYDASPWYGNDNITSVVIEKGVKALTCTAMFYKCGNLKQADLSGLDTSAVTDMRGLFYKCENLKHADLSGLDTSAVTDMRGLFYECTNLESVDLTGLDISADTDAKYLFKDCTSITKLTLPTGLDFENASLRSSSWRASSGTNYATTAEMLAANASRTGDAITYRTISVTPGWSQAGSCEWRIDDAGFLTVRPLGSSGTGTLKAWEEAEEVPWYYQRETITAVNVATGVSALTCANMFDGCINLDAADVAGLDVSAVTDMSYMFANCTSLTSVPTGLTVASGANVDKLFYVDSETAVAIHYDGEDSAITGYDWANDNRTLVIKCTGEHDWDEGVITKAQTCTEPGEKTLTCTVCGEVEEGVVVEATGHSFGEWETVVKATCETNGLERRTCGNDATHTETREIAQLAHDWFAPVILFSADCTSATALWTCKNNASHLMAAACDVTSTVAAATCETAEVTTYTATAKLEGMPGGSATTTRTTASAKGHAWSNPTIVFTADKAFATATWTCAADSTHKHTEICTVEKKEKKAATCFARGEIECVATAAIEGTTAKATDTAIEYTPATGHNFKDENCTDCKTHLGDANGNGKINVVDAQIAYEIAAGNSYEGLDIYDALYAASDVTGKNGVPDGYVDAQDAYAILYAAVFGWDSMKEGN